jgi:phospholipid-translocating ATPase
VYSYADFSAHSFILEWEAKYHLANSALDRRDDLLRECFASLEKDLSLLGVTAIEDRLQDGVPETIQLLRAAGIKVWMLTGDKRATAIQIAQTCNMISSEPAGETISLDFTTKNEQGKEPDFMEVRTQLETQHKTVLDRRAGLTSGVDGDEGGSRSPLSIIIDGASLRRVLDDPASILAFMDLCMLAEVVVCCRVTPLQKSRMVEMVNSRGHTTLAIGDGGNDVSMIQKANIGVGIKGREGLQAARSADYCIGKFRYLSRLILIHGRHAYRRTAFVALYCFYKSVFLATGQALYQFYCGFSGTSLLNTFSLSTYNILFTGLPILFYTLDKDMADRTVFKFPKVYQESVKGLSFNRNRFLLWIIRSIIQSTIAFYVVLACFQDINADPQGRSHGETNFALAVFTSAIVIQTVTLIIESHGLTIYNWVIILGTAAFFFIAMQVIASVPSLGMYGAADELYNDPIYYFSFIAAAAGALILPLALKYYSFNYRPKMSELMYVPCHPQSC